MRAETQQRQFPERTLQQVRLDCGRAMERARFCLESSVIHTLRCVDNRDESERHFGNQLWYFEGVGVDEGRHRQNVFGVVEYSLQYGLQELVEDGVFDSPHERERFRSLYNREVNSPSWRQPSHRWLAIAAFAIVALTLVAFLLRSLFV